MFSSWVTFTIEVVMTAGSMFNNHVNIAKWCTLDDHIILKEQNINMFYVYVSMLN